MNEIKLWSYYDYITEGNFSVVLVFIELRNKIKMASEPNSQSGSQRSEHEKLYSPSEWSKRFGPEEVSNPIVLLKLIT